jgi:hypothetical protein
MQADTAKLILGILGLTDRNLIFHELFLFLLLTLSIAGVFGNMHDPKAALLRASLQVKPSGHVVISHPMGRAW